MEHMNDRLGHSMKEFSELVGVSMSTTKRLLRDGGLPYTRAGRRVIISRKTIEAFLEGKIEAQRS